MKINKKQFNSLKKWQPASTVQLIRFWWSSNARTRKNNRLARCSKILRKLAKQWSSRQRAELWIMQSKDSRINSTSSRILTKTRTTLQSITIRTMIITFRTSQVFLARETQITIIKCSLWIKIKQIIHLKLQERQHWTLIWTSSGTIVTFCNKSTPCTRNIWTINETPTSTLSTTRQTGSSNNSSSSSYCTPQLVADPLGLTKIVHCRCARQLLKQLIWI